ncbi:DNA-3-methyladenine glycosylase family protein [Cytobacillus gottheilii]|uniref:DNA-3-methyladenine glycosylase II n=1 Tax=Cytobacillus gottheilii TaxID=859144 RepID=A0ABX8FE96_9BACI|nr:DNA-3-methyladenine glycosylase [Cytobacillus gottheilii]QVY62336.1 DNA-3-methyladenine glycosylase 2 family protein [Cytobacillus gottheilii]
MDILTVEGPYNFDLVLSRLALDPLHVVDMEKRFVKVPLLIDKTPVVAKVQAFGTTDEPKFKISGIEEPYQKQAQQRIAAIFQWNIKLAPIHDFFIKTDLKEIFTDHRGTPLFLEFDPYSSLMKLIIHQQVNLKFAYTLTERFVRTFGFEKDGVPFYPLPETVAQLSIEELRELQFSGRKAEYVIGIGKAATEGYLQYEELKNMSDEEIYDTLIKLRGVGPWTVQNFLMFGLGRPNLFPTADIGIQNALKKLYDLPVKPTQEEMQIYAQHWEPYLSYASLYLWRSIE